MLLYAPYILRDSSPARSTSKPILAERLCKSPRSKKLFKLQRSRDMWRSRYIRLKSGKKQRTRKEQTISTQAVLEKTKELLPTEAFELFSLQIRLSRMNKYRRRYNDAIMDLSLSLYYHSPRTYRFLRQKLQLPTIRTLFNYQEGFPIYAGLNEQVFETLKKVFSKARIEDLVVTLLFDEIHLQRELHYDVKNDKYIGVADDGCSREPKEAKTALVSMITWINRPWKQALGSQLLPSKGNSMKMHEIVMRTLNKLYDIGLIVKVIVWDQGPLNVSVVSRLNVSAEKPYFLFRGIKVYVIYDPPHLEKSIRNNVKNRLLCYKETIVYWSDLKKVFDLGKLNRLNLIPKVSLLHFELTKFSKMRVKFAAQIFSHSMHTALLCYQMMFPNEFTKLDARPNGTADFVSDMDKIFDCVNSLLIKPTVGDKLNYAIGESTSHREFMMNMKENFENCRFLSGNTPPCISGWILTISAILELSEDLRKNFNISRLRTRRLCQDPLENFFAVIRQQNGNCDKPSAQKFMAGFRHNLITHLAKISDKTNCEIDATSYIVKLKKAKQSCDKKAMSCIGTEVKYTEFENLVIEDEKSPVAEFGENSAIYYIAGYLARTFLKRISCTSCKTIIKNDSLTALVEEHQIFTMLKTYENSELIHPSRVVYDSIKKWELIFKQNIKNILHVNNILQTFANIITSSSPHIELCCSDHSAAFLHFYLRCRLHWEARFRREEIDPVIKEIKFMKFTG